MYATTSFSLLTLVSLVRGHGAITKATGDKGTSVGFAVNPSLARNCTTISPCQLDATIIRDAEINANIVNGCGRTELAGNIDIGQFTEDALAAGAVTQVQKGSNVDITIHQVNADGAGPYSCDMDFTSNSGTLDANLTVENNVPGVNGLSQAKAQDFKINVKMPANLACTGGSTGNICTVRCRNNAVAGPFGGCFAVMQTDITAKQNTPNNIATIQQLDAINSQIEVNKQDFNAAIQANQNAGTADALKNEAAAQQLGGVSVVTKPSPVQTPAIVNNAGAASAASATTSAATGQKGNGNAKGNAGAKAGANAVGAKAGANGNQKRDGSLRWALRSVLPRH